MGHRVGGSRMHFHHQNSGIPDRVEQHHNMEGKMFQQVQPVR